MTAMLTNRAAERDQLRADLLTAVRGWRDAKRRFVARTTWYESRYGVGTVEAEFQARDDHQRKVAIADADWFQREVQTAGIALVAAVLDAWEAGES